MTRPRVGLSRGDQDTDGGDNFGAALGWMPAPAGKRRRRRRKTPVPRSYRLRYDASLAEDPHGLTAGQVQVLADIGVLGADQLRELLRSADPGRVADHLAVDATSLARLEAKLANRGVSDPAEREQLMKLPCPPGVRLASTPRAADFRDRTPGIRVGAAGQDDGRPQRPAPPSVPIDIDPNREGFDLIDEMSPIRDQGARQTCTAHALVRVLEFHVRRQRSRRKDLSPQYLYWHSKQMDGDLDNEACTMEAAGAAVETEATCLEDLCPYMRQRYDDATDGCQRGPAPSPAARKNADRYRHVWAYLIPPRTEELRRRVCNHQPVVLVIPVFSIWYNNPQVRRDGQIILPMAGEEPTGHHAVTVVGYGLDERQPGGGYLMFDNSWGTTWAAQNVLKLPGRGFLPFAYVDRYCPQAWTMVVERPARAEEAG